jgi:YgiT-type zinc finger domain-containing protein
MERRLQESTLMRECVHCKGSLERGTAPFSVDRAGYHVAWNALPAWVCSQCGEPYFEPAIVAVIEESLRNIDRATADITAAG